MPKFAAELKQRLAASERPELAEQLDTLELLSRCGCGDGFCSTFYVSGGQSALNAEDQKSRGPYYRNSLDVDASEGMVVVDTDHLDRIVGVEVLNRPDVEAELKIALERVRHAL